MKWTGKRFTGADVFSRSSRTVESRLVPQSDNRVAMSRLIRSYRQARCVGVAGGFWVGVGVEFGLAERLAEAPRTAADLAAEVGAHAPSLRRLLRALVAIGVVAQDGSDRYALTPLGEEMRQDRLGPSARFFNSEHHWQSWLHLDHSIKTGERAFDFVYGQRTWDYYSTHPEEAAIFDAAMSSITGPVSKAVAAAYDFSRFQLVADIGGGDGPLLTESLHRYPSVKGLLFDLPPVVERARKKLADSGLLDRCEVMGGSFLEKVPPG